MGGLKTDLQPRRALAFAHRSGPPRRRSSSWEVAPVVEARDREPCHPLRPNAHNWTNGWRFAGTPPGLDHATSEQGVQPCIESKSF